MLGSNIGKSVVRTKNIGTVKSKAVADFTKNTAMGTKTSIRTVTSGGTLVGLQKKAPAHINMNDAGYLNPMNHTARYKNKTFVPTNISQYSTMGTQYNRSVDYRVDRDPMRSVAKLRG